MEIPARILIAKPGLDGHDRGAKIIATALRDAGMEVIYTGIRQTPENIVNTAIEEDVDIIGVSILSGAHGHLLPRILELLKKSGAGSIPLVAGGVIPDDDLEMLKEYGVSGVFTPGSSLEEIISSIKKILNKK